MQPTLLRLSGSMLSTSTSQIKKSKRSALSLWHSHTHQHPHTKTNKCWSEQEFRRTKFSNACSQQLWLWISDDNCEYAPWWEIVQCCTMYYEASATRQFFIPRLSHDLQNLAKVKLKRGLLLHRRPLHFTPARQQHVKFSFLQACTCTTNKFFFWFRHLAYSQKSFTG